MSYFKIVKDPLDRKRLSKYFGMSLSNPGLPEQIKNIFWMYYIPEEGETWAMNTRKEAAFFGVTLLCAADRHEIFSDISFEQMLPELMSKGTESAQRKLKSLFMSNMSRTVEFVETLGRVLRRDEMMAIVEDVNIERLVTDLIQIENAYKSPYVKQRWASNLYRTDALIEEKE